MTINAPTSWKDVTVKQYQELKEVPSLGFDPLDAQLRILQILTGVSDEVYLNMPMPVVVKLIKKVDFINELPKNLIRKHTIKIKGRRFRVNYLVQTLNAGEYIDLMNLTKDGKADDNIVKILAICLKPVNWMGGHKKGCYKKSKDGFLIQTDESRRWTEKNIPEGLTMDIVIPLSGFFLKTWQGLISGMQDFLSKKAKIAMETAEKELSLQMDLPKHTVGTQP